MAPGVVAAGAEVQVVDRPSHDQTMSKLFRAAMGDRDLAMTLLSSPDLRTEMADYFRDRYT